MERLPCITSDPLHKVEIGPFGEVTSYVCSLAVGAIGKESIEFDTLWGIFGRGKSCGASWSDDGYGFSE